MLKIIRIIILKIIIIIKQIIIIHKIIERRNNI